MCIFLNYREPVVFNVAVIFWIFSKQPAERPMWMAVHQSFGYFPENTYGPGYKKPATCRAICLSPTVLSLFQCYLNRLKESEIIFLKDGCPSFVIRLGTAVVPEEWDSRKLECRDSPTARTLHFRFARPIPHWNHRGPFFRHTIPPCIPISFCFTLHSYLGMQGGIRNTGWKR